MTFGRITATIFIFLVVSFLVDFSQKPRYPKSLPKVGYGDGLVATLRNWVAYISSFNDWATEGYKKYSKQNRAFVVPCAPSRPQEIVVPRSQTMWMLDQPEKILSTHEAHDDVLYSEYNFLGKDYGEDQYGIHVIHKSLARNLPGMITSIQEEVHDAVDDAFGKDTEWRKINLWECWLGIVPKVTNRMLVGKPICRDETFLKSMVGFADAVVMNSFVLNMFPKVLQPIIGRLCMIPNWRLWNRSLKVVEPTFQKRLDDMARKLAGDPEYENWSPPEDFVTWMIRLATAEGRYGELNPASISKRLLPVEFAAIHTTVITGHNIILDLLASDPKEDYLERIREETNRVQQEDGGNWTINGLRRLYRTDSAIRESQRFSHFATSLIRRKVIAKGGLTNPTEGWHAPYGSFLILDLANVQHDEDLYENANNYDAFRYSRPREEYETRASERRDADEALKMAKLGMVTTSDAHLAFGHGRHACPGRFFVAHELKMILAYLSQNYEFKPLAERPKPQWIGQTIIPPLQAMVEVRRRPGTV